MLSLPYFPWVSMPWRRYPELAAADILAGLTVGIMLVPQGGWIWVLFVWYQIKTRTHVH